MDQLVKTIREFIVDIFGALIPGVVFLFGTLIALVMPMLQFIEMVFIKTREGDRRVLTGETLETFSIRRGDRFILTGEILDALAHLYTEILLLMLVLAFITGVLFSRKDQNLPDSISYHRLPLEDRLLSPAYVSTLFRGRHERRHIEDFIFSSIFHGFRFYLYFIFLRIVRVPALARFMRWVARRLPWRSGVFVHYPYANLKKYLAAIGNQHLADLIPWTPEHGLDARSRFFMSVIKARIALAFPEKYGIIAYNDAVSRLLSSVYYSCRPLWLFAFIGSLLGISALAVSGLDPVHTTITAVAIVTFLSVCMIEKTILNSFHHIRVREAIYILETAYFLDKTVPEAKILEDLPRPKRRAVRPHHERMDTLKLRATAARKHTRRVLRLYSTCLAVLAALTLSAAVWAVAEFVVDGLAGAGAS